MSDETSGSDRYATQEMDDGTVRIFDTENDAAWIESDMALALGWQT